MYPIRFRFVGVGLDPPAQIALQFGISRREIIPIIACGNGILQCKMPGRGKTLPYDDLLEDML